jgi:4-amino-4-deoxy-L-arabinose transferase-like glycosyltransferase
MKAFYEKIFPVLRWLIQVTETLLLGLLVFAGLLTLFHQILSITYRFPLDYGEAPLVDQAYRLANGLPIYRSDLSSPPFTISNYPPLYILSLTPFVKFFDPNFWSGRLISSISAWMTAWFLGLILWRKTQDRWASVTAGLVFLAFPYGAYRSPGSAL